MYFLWKNIADTDGKWFWITLVFQVLRCTHSHSVALTRCSSAQVAKFIGHCDWCRRPWMPCSPIPCRRGSWYYNSVLFILQPKLTYLRYHRNCRPWFRRNIESTTPDSSLRKEGRYEQSTLSRRCPFQVSKFHWWHSFQVGDTNVFALESIQTSISSRIHTQSLQKMLSLC